MPTSRLWAGNVLAAAGLVLVTVAGGAVLSGSAPAQAADWYGADEGAATGLVEAPAIPGQPDASVALPASSVPPARAASSVEPTVPVVRSVASSAASTTRAASTTVGADDAALPPIPPSPAIHLWISAIAVDAQVLPVDSVPTGARNAWGGEVFAPIDFPVDRYVRQWVRRGDPNSVPAAQSRSDVKAFDRTVLYGHASDIGHHLIFQDLSALKTGDSVTVDTALGRFVYAVTAVVTRAKASLDDMAALYDYPADGRKELALVACLPDTTSNVVVFARLVAAQSLSD